MSKINYRTSLKHFFEEKKEDHDYIALGLIDVDEYLDDSKISLASKHIRSVLNPEISFHIFREDFNFIIFYSKKVFLVEDLSQELKGMIFAVDGLSDNKIVISLSDVMRGNKINFNNMIMQASSLLSRLPVIQNSTVLTKTTGIYKNIADIQEIFDRDFLDKLYYDISYGKTEKIEKYVEDKLSLFNTDNSYYYVNWITQVINASYLICNDTNALIEEVGYTYIEYLYVIQGLRDKNEVLEKVMVLIEACARINSGQEEGRDAVYQRIVGYVSAHYADPDISVKNLAEELSFSKSYVFAQMKKHNSSFKKLLTDFRIGRAKELLVNEKYTKISYIAQRCGYPDAYYFSSVFHQTVGMSPREYRKACQQSDRTGSKS